MAKKGVKTGPRVAVSWGAKKVKTKTGTKTIPAVSFVSQHVLTITGLKEYKFKATLNLNKDKKGRLRIAAQGVTRSASRYVLIWNGELSPKSKQKVWHRVPIPAGISLARASTQLQAGKKVVEVRFPSTLPGRNAKLKDASGARGAGK
jgi:hypothetical protein